MNELTLADRLGEGPLPAGDVLRYAVGIAEALRKIHDSGRAHGGLSPAAVVLGTGCVTLEPAQKLAVTVTPYTAPELLKDNAADARSDIFAFGALFYEMLTGRKAFEADTQEALALVLTNAAPPSLGRPALDRLVGGCVAKDPAARWQRMQKVLMELRLLTVSARRADPDSASRRDGAEAAARAAMRELEARLAARLEAYEVNLGEARAAAAAGQQALVASVAATQAALQSGAEAIHGQLAVAVERLGRSEQCLSGLEPRVLQLEQRMEAVLQGVARAEQSFEAMLTRVASAEGNFESAQARLVRTEESLEAARKATEAFQETMAVELGSVDQAVRAQASAIESARTAMAQTDDLVERVVEALEVLQTMVLEQAEGSSAA